MADVALGIVRAKAATRQGVIRLAIAGSWPAFWFQSECGCSTLKGVLLFSQLLNSSFVDSQEFYIDQLYANIASNNDSFVQNAFESVG